MCYPVTERKGAWAAVKRLDPVYKAYCDILRKDLQMATGCTEPIAVACCAAKAHEVLGCLPERMDVQVSGNILKNVKSVVVPNTDGLKGIAAAAAAGIVAGDSGAGLLVLDHVSEAQRRGIRAFLDQVPISVSPMRECDVLDICVTVAAGADQVLVRLNKSHTNICLIQRNGETLFDIREKAAEDGDAAVQDPLSIRGICEFAEVLEVEDVRPMLEPQITCNTAIAEEGLRGHWGADIGSILLRTQGDGVRCRARAMAAAGSDARMSGCEMPVVINSGSGNQGLTVSMPVIEYWRELKREPRELYQALAVSNLCAIHLKAAIGKLSAYCGAVSAGSAAAAGVAWLITRDFETIAHTIANSLAIDSGIVCDGAKPSCAAKIATAIDNGLLGLEMYLNGSQFYGGDGILSSSVENTIDNVGQLGRDGMRDTDLKIIEIMSRELGPASPAKE